MPLVQVSSACLFALLLVGGAIWPTWGEALAALGSEPAQAYLDSASGGTRVIGHVTPSLCFSLPLPQEWRAEMRGGRTVLQSASSAELEVSLRFAADIGADQPLDPAARVVVALQREYEYLLGRPAQSVLLSPSLRGAMHWSATWIDANLPITAHTLTVEAFIIPLSEDWMLVLSPNGMKASKMGDAYILTILSGLTMRRAGEC